MTFRRSALFVFLLMGHIAVAQSATLTVTVLDETSVAVRTVRVTLQPRIGPPLRCETSFAGRCQFSDLTPGPAELRAEKEAFYVVTVPMVEIGAIANVDITLTHIQEIKEVVEVVESPPAIDPAKTQAQEQLTGMDIINIPYPATNDYRNVLNFIPGVQQDSTGQPHLAG